MNQKKTNRQQRVIAYLQKQLHLGKKVDKALSNLHLSHEDTLIDLTDTDKSRIKRELESLLNPKAKKTKKNTSEGPQNLTDRWYIDIYTVKYGYIKNSERRKNKGKSRKKMKKAKTLSLLKTVVAQPGMLLSYKEGRMGLSPKAHIFKVRKEESFQP